jgi:hypothetical protein
LEPGFEPFDFQGRTIWIADAHRGDGMRFIVRADEKLTALVELEGAVRCSGCLSGLQESRQVLNPDA